MFYKRFLIVLFILISIGGIAQDQPIGAGYRYDTGKGDALSLRFSIAIINLIEQNKPDEILKYCSKDCKIDKADLIESCSKISKYFPFEKHSFPASIVKKSNTELWYERSYYTMVAAKRKYFYQVHIEISSSEKQKITALEIRSGKNIIDRVPEFKQNRIPGMPPPPPAIPSKI